MAANISWQHTSALPICLGAPKESAAAHHTACRLLENRTNDHRCSQLLSQLGRADTTAEFWLVSSMRIEQCISERLGQECSIDKMPRDLHPTSAALPSLGQHVVEPELSKP